MGIRVVAQPIGVIARREDQRHAVVDFATNPLDRDQYHFDEAIFETIPSEAEIAGIVRPILDQMASASGRATSPIFDAQGHYIQASMSMDAAQ